MSTMQPIRDPKDIERLKRYFLNRGETRNYVLIVVGINLPVRISDLLGLKWKDVYNYRTDTFRSHLTLIEQKTGKKNVLMMNTVSVMLCTSCTVMGTMKKICISLRLIRTLRSRLQGWQRTCLSSRRQRSWGLRGSGVIHLGRHSGIMPGNRGLIWH